MTGPTRSPNEAHFGNADDATASENGSSHWKTDLAFLVPSLGGGGAERVMMDLAQDVAAGGRMVDMVVVSRRGSSDYPSLGPGVRIIQLNQRRVALALPAFLRYLRSARPPAILSTLEHTNVLALVSTRIVRGGRVVIREANTYGEGLSGGSFIRWVLRRLMKLTYPSASSVIAVSEGVATSLRSGLGLPETLISVIPNPVITQRLRNGAGVAVDHPWFAEGAPPVVLGVGRLTEQKGFDILIRAFADARRVESCRLLLLGEGELRRDLETLIGELGVTDDVDMPGFVNNPFAYMARSGVFVLSSRWEGLPNVLIQALAVGAKVVATDCPSGPFEITDGGRLASLVAVDDVAGMAAAIVNTLRTDRVEPESDWYRRYSLEDVASRYLELLEPKGSAERYYPSQDSKS